MDVDILTARRLNYLVQLIVYINSLLKRNGIKRSDVHFMRVCVRNLFWNLNKQNKIRDVDRKRNILHLVDILQHFILDESYKLSKSYKIKQLDVSNILLSSSELEEFAKDCSISKERAIVIKEFLIRSTAK